MRGILAIAIASVVGVIALAPAPAQAKRLAPTAKVIKLEVQGSDVVITLDRGSDQGVTAGWRGHLVNGRGIMVQGSAFTILRVTKRTSVAKVKLTFDQVKAFPRAIIEPP